MSMPVAPYPCLCKGPAAYWAEEVQPPVPWPTSLSGREHVRALAWAMDPLVTFVEGDVFVTTALSRWTEITLAMVDEGYTTRTPEKLHTCSSRVLPKGIPVCQPTVETSDLHLQPHELLQRQKDQSSPPQEFMPLQSTSDHKPPCPPPGFEEIAQALVGGRTHGRVAHHRSSPVFHLRKS